MGFFSKIKSGISSKANSALDKAIDPAKELDMAIMELDDGRKKALQELISYKTTAKTLEAEIEKFKAKAAEWERRAMVAVRAGDDESAKQALREQKAAAAEVVKIIRDRNEAQGYAVQLNKSRKEFETKLQMLKLRKGTLATQLTAARSAGGDAFGNDASVWDRFKAAEDKIDEEAIASEVDVAMRGEADGSTFDAQLAAVARPAGLLTNGEGLEAGPNGPEDALAKLKTKMEAAKAAKAAAQLPAGDAPGAIDAAKDKA